MNGRFAMIGAAGILGTEILGVSGKWYERGAMEYTLPLLPLIAIQALVMGFLETKRLEGFNETGEVCQFLPPTASLSGLTLACS